MSPELSEAKVTTTMLLISEVLMLTAMVLTHTGTNSSSMIMDGLSMKKDKFLEFKANLIMRIDNLLEKRD
jgi:hypothetical protein